MSELQSRLTYLVTTNAVHGTLAERADCDCAMQDAAYEIERLEQRLAAAESRIAELVSGIKEAQIELIETGKIYALGLSCQKRLVTELEQRLAAAESRIAELESELVKQVRGSGVVFDICLWESIKRDGGNVTLIDEGTKQSEVK